VHYVHIIIKFDQVYTDIIPKLIDFCIHYINILLNFDQVKTWLCPSFKVIFYIYYVLFFPSWSEFADQFEIKANLCWFSIWPWRNGCGNKSLKLEAMWYVCKFYMWRQNGTRTKQRWQHELWPWSFTCITKSVYKWNFQV
jgi:hypothetical protein